jgi:hypothetical protein
MDLYFLDKPKFQRLYNCTFYKIEWIPLEERVHVFWGCFFLVASALFTVSINFLPNLAHLNSRFFMFHACMQ